MVVEVPESGGVSLLAFPSRAGNMVIGRVRVADVSWQETGVLQECVVTWKSTTGIDLAGHKEVGQLFGQ